MKTQKTAVIAILLGLGNLLWAALPEITAEQLVAAALNADGNYQNLRATYQVDEQFNLESNWRFPVPNHRSLVMVHAVSGSLYFYRAHVTSDDPVSFPAWTYSDAWNGSVRTQYMAQTNHGDIFGQPFSHAFTIPADFGLSLGSRRVALGNHLAQSRINTIESVSLNGIDVYSVSGVKPDGKDFEVWIDPAIGWRARQLITYNQSGGKNYEMTSSAWQQFGNVWFPVSGTALLYGNDPTDPGKRAVSTTRDLTVQSVTFDPMSAADFKIVFAPGTKVYDHIVDLPYVVDDAGELELIERGTIIALDPSNRPGAQDLACDCTGTTQWH